MLNEEQFRYLEVDANLFCKEFPDSIKLEQTVALWKYIVYYQVYDYMPMKVWKEILLALSKLLMCVCR